MVQHGFLANPGFHVTQSHEVSKTSSTTKTIIFASYLQKEICKTNSTVHPSKNQKKKHRITLHDMRNKGIKWIKMAEHQPKEANHTFEHHHFPKETPRPRAPSSFLRRQWAVAPQTLDISSTQGHVLEDFTFLWPTHTVGSPWDTRRKKNQLAKTQTDLKGLRSKFHEVPEEFKNCFLKKMIGHDLN